MSVRLISLVWDKFEASGSELLCMLALADFANDQGGSIHPSIKTLSIKIRASESQARRVLHKLIDDGFVSVVGNHDGGAPGMSRRYRIDVAKLKALPDVGETGSVDATPSTGATGGMDARDGLHGCAETAGMGDTQTTNEPSENRQLKTKVKDEPIGLPDWLPKSTWADYLEMRKRIKKPATLAAQKLLLGTLAKLRTAGHDPQLVLEQSIVGSWQGLFELKARSNATGKPSGTHTNFKDKDYGTGTPDSEIPWAASPEA